MIDLYINKIQAMVYRRIIATTNEYHYRADGIQHSKVIFKYYVSKHSVIETFDVSEIGLAWNYPSGITEINNYMFNFHNKKDII